MRFFVNSIMRRLLLLLFPVSIFAQNPGDTLFSEAIVHDIHITFSQTGWWDSLTIYKAQNDQATTYAYLKGDVIIDGDTLSGVGVRLKGNASYNHPGTKKSLVLSFNEFTAGQKYDGLKAFHLNNSAYDPTMLREKLYLDLLNRSGLPAPRCAFARVSYNGQYAGLYKIVESVDKTFLKTRFGEDEQNLFKGDPNSPLVWEGSLQDAYYDNFELKTNESANDWSDLVALHDVINNSGTNFQQQLEENFDVRNYLRAWAANNVFGNLDSYMYFPHNYYLYNDSLAGKFRWISWDVGVVFGVIPTGFNAQEDFPVLYLPETPESLPLNNNLLKVAQYQNEYLNYCCWFLDNELRSSKLFPAIDSLAARIRPHVQAEPEANRMYTLQDFENNLGYGPVSSWLVFSIPGLKEFISQRRGKLTEQLCEMQWSCLLGESYEHLPAEDMIRVYPSPASDRVTVSFTAAQSQVSALYEVADMQGRILLRENAQLEEGAYVRTIDTSRWRPGVYYLRVLAGCSFVEKKIVIIR